MTTAGEIDCCVDCTGELVINAISMHTPAWCCTDLSSLNDVTELRGSNVVIPHAAGQRAYPRRLNEMTHELPFVITGAVDMAGTPYSDSAEGLQTNLDYLYANVVGPPTAPTATVAATYTPPGMTLINADIQVDGLELIQRAGPLQTARLVIRIPAGRFA